jgi:hypothetical protein
VVPVGGTVVGVVVGVVVGTGTLPRPGTFQVRWAAESWAVCAVTAGTAASAATNAAAGTNLCSEVDPIVPIITALWE